jgi:hypothetical protein
MTNTSRYHPLPYVTLKHPEWSKNATIYQINTRQFTSEGTFKAAETHLPRLKALGADILMPVHEIGVLNRKGTLGSPYAVRDYYSVNAEFGTLDDLKHFVQAAHEHGMYVIIDWVANHTAWDCNLVTEHPEWYVRDWKGDFMPTPWWDWTDIIDLDYTGGCGKPTSTVSAATLLDSCPPIFGIRSARNWTRSSRCSCSQSGNRATSMPKPST